MKKAFTLIEITIVTTIIGILASVLIPRLTSQINRVKNNVSIKDISIIVSALDIYYMDYSSYPISSSCSGVTKSDCSLRGVKETISSYLSSIPDSNNIDTPWSFGSGYLVPLKNEYGYIGRGSYYILSYFFVDLRDSKKYRAIRMPDKKRRMADDLQYASPNSSCYGGLPSACNDGYGRLYPWADTPIACPGGWHLPSDEERYNLLTSIEVINKNIMANHYRYGYANGSAGLYLKKIFSGVTANDAFGFSAMIGGMGSTVLSSYTSRGIYGFYWTSTMTGSSVYFRRFQNNASWVYYSAMNPFVQKYRYAIRCVRD